MTFNVWTFLFEIVNFVMLAYILHRLLYRPLRQAIDERRAAAHQVQADAETARQEANALQQKLQVELQGVEQHRQESMRQAREQADAERKKLLAETEQTVQRRQEELRQALQRDREEALQELRGEVVRQAVDLSERILREAAERTLTGQLTLRLVDTLKNLPASEREHLRDQCQRKDETVLETSAELDSATIRQIKEALGVILGQEPELAVRTSPALIGGLRLRLSGHVWDASLAGVLKEAGKPAQEAASHV